MKRIEFWKAVSSSTTAISGLMLIILMFFKKYIESIMYPFLLVGLIVLLISILSELMKFILKRKS
jgi:hypothetical protein